MSRLANTGDAVELESSADRYKVAGDASSIPSAQFVVSSPSPLVGEGWGEG